MPLFAPAGLLWSHPSHNHSSEGVCAPTLRHRGKNRPTSLSPPLLVVPSGPPAIQIAVVSEVSPVHCGPLFRLMC